MSETKLTERDWRVLAVMCGEGSVTPTWIGKALGKSGGQASAYVAASLRRLVSAGAVKRTEIDGRAAYHAAWIG